MEPYQQASEEIYRQGELPSKILRKGTSLIGNLGASYLGGATISKVLPFLSQYIPENLAIKGLSKIDPRFGKFIDMALKNGKSFDEVRDFISSKAEESTQSSPDQKNIIQKYSPELFEFMKKHIDNGRSVLEAGALAEMGGKFKNIISKMVKENKSPWSSIVESVFGATQKRKPMTREEALSAFREKRMREPDNEIQGQMEQQPGQGQQALMAILQKIQQSRGA